VLETDPTCPWGSEPCRVDQTETPAHDVTPRSLSLTALVMPLDG
jgi:hypothetical protein